MTIAVDFDGTIVEHKYPAIGKEKPFAIETLKQLADEGNKLILWTSRDGELLQEALDFCHKRGLDFYGVNSNQPVGSLFEGRAGSTSVKVVADVYIDDKNLGGLPDWGTIHEIITGIREKQHARRRKGLFRRLSRR
jgi:hypothetical protein